MANNEKRYLVGRRDEGENGLLLLGRYLALDGSSGAPVFLDILKPHAILICGKRGYGKSYTMGSIIEEFALLKPSVKKNFSIIVIDTMGIYTKMSLPSDGINEVLWPGLKPCGIDIKTFIPRKHITPENRDSSIIFEIPSRSLSAYDYCELLGIEPVSAHGAAMMGAISRLENFSIKSLIEEINSMDIPLEVRSTLTGLLSMVSTWELFSKDASYCPLLEPGSINIIDLSGYGHDPGIKSCIVASLSRALYDLRTRSRRFEENGDRQCPLIWMFIDEAHMFLDSAKNTGAGHVLINEWLRQGRQPGLSLVLATQRPSALGKDVLSQADIIICHRLTLKDDLESLESSRPLYVKEPVREALLRLGTSRGASIIIDDTTECCHVIRIRPRISMHGGSEPAIHDID